jgi:putative transposase
MRRITRSYRIRVYPNGAQRRLRDQDTAFRNFFAGRARYSKFKRKGSAGSLRFPGAGAACKRGILTLPKLGVLKLDVS